MVPAWASLRPGVQVSAEPPRQLDVERVQVDVAHALEELGGPGLGQGLGQSVAPGLVLALESAKHSNGVGRRRRPAPQRAHLAPPHVRASARGYAGAFFLSVRPPGLVEPLVKSATIGASGSRIATSV